MKLIFNTLHERILNLEIALQANHLTSERSSVVRNDSPLPDQKPTITKQGSTLMLDQHKQNLNVERHSSSGALTVHTPKLLALPLIPSSNATISQIKLRAHEFAAIFEDAFDQLNILHRGLNTATEDRYRPNASRSNSVAPLTTGNAIDKINCSPYALNLAGLSRVPERVKLSDEMEYFCDILLLVFRALLLQSDSDFSTVMESTANPLSSTELTALNERLNVSREKIAQFSFVKKHFRQDTNDQFQILQITRSQLKDRLMEEQYRANVALRYCHAWKTNHILQWIEMLLHIEQTYTKTIQQYERVLRQTDQAHQETIRMLIEQNQQMHLRGQHWYEHYLNETDRFERELRHFRQEFQTIKQQRQEMSEEYQRMKLVVDEYHQKKAEERLLLEKQKQQSEAMKRIQAWWRGTMVRHLRAPKRRKKKK